VAVRTARAKREKETGTQGAKLRRFYLQSPPNTTGKRRAASRLWLLTAADGIPVRGSGRMAGNTELIQIGEPGGEQLLRDSHHSPAIVSASYLRFGLADIWTCFQKPCSCLELQSNLEILQKPDVALIDSLPVRQIAAVGGGAQVVGPGMNSV